MLEQLEGRVLFSVFSVTNTLDAGEGSLRQAILDANANPGADTIAFALPGPGVQTIAPASPLPAVTDTLALDGTTQPGYAGRPLVELNGAAAGFGAVGLEIDAPGSSVTALAVNGFSGPAVHLGAGSDSSTVAHNFLGTDVTGTVAEGNGRGVLVDSPGAFVLGNLISANAGDGVAVNAAGATIQGNFIGTDVTGSLALGNQGNGVYLLAGGGALVGGTSAGARNVISANTGSGVYLRSSSNVVAGNFIGTDAAGLLRSDAAGNRLGNQGHGVNVAFNSGNNTIGGSTASARNVISGNFGNGVTLGTGSAPGNTIQGNFIGTDATGSAADGNGGDAVLVRSAGAVIGGASLGQGNVLSANGGDGLDLADGGTVQGNFIGTAADGATPLGNANDGVFVNGSGNTIGSVGAVAGVASGANVIAFNGGTGVAVFNGTANAVRGNSIYANGSVGIDLGLDGATPNDADGHAGPNNFQNFPVLGTLANTRAGLTVAGTLDADPASTFTIDFYTSAAADPSGYGQGQVWLGSVAVTTDAAGHASFSATLAAPAAGQGFLSATATDAAGNTSEFAPPVAVPPLPLPTPTLTGLSSSLNPATSGQAVTFTAIVAAMAAASSTPTGVVTFMDGQTVLGSSPLDASGTASFTTSTLAVGGHTITAVYSGDAHFVASTSAPLAQTVAPKPATLATLGGHVWLADSRGPSAGVIPMAGVTVQLYLDKDGNGRLNGGDGSPVATTVTAADGSYAFVNIPAGLYFVKEVVPARSTCTAPSAGYYTLNTAGGASATNLDFTNFSEANKVKPAHAQPAVASQPVAKKSRPGHLRRHTRPTRSIRA